MVFSKLPAPIGKPPETHYIFTTLNRFFMLLSRFPPRFAFWILCLLVFVIIQTVDRIAPMGWVSVTHPDSFPLLLLTLPVGLLDDTAMGVVLGLPFLAGMYLFASLLRRPAFRVASHVLFYGMLALLVFIEVAQFVFWNEFDSRPNGIAYYYLIFPHEVVGNIRESFDLRPVFPLIAAAAAALYWPLRHRLSAALGAKILPGEGRQSLKHGAAYLVVALALLHFGPLMMGGRDRVINEVAINAQHSLLRAALTNDSEYAGLYPSLPAGEAVTMTRAMVAQDNTRPLAHRGGLWRHVDNGQMAKRLNVVLVMQESFGSIYVDDLDNQSGESISPALTGLGQKGLFFTNVYATGTRTVRGLEAVLNSFPPIPGISTSRRSGSKGMNSLPFLLNDLGYETAFLYGGRGIFDNMGAYWNSIGFNNVWDIGDIEDQGFTTSWGVADEYLFTEAIRRMDEFSKDEAMNETTKNKPFFLGLLTVSNHRPYTYPEGRIDKDPAAMRRQNAATYADWAFGDFIERSRGHLWFEDTVFIFVGDHGPRIYGAAQVPVPSYRVPLLFYAPRHIAPERNTSLGTIMDLGPTLLGLLGVSYDSPFFGVDLRRVEDGKGRVIMSHNYKIAYGDGKDVAVLVPSGDTRGYTMEPGPGDLVSSTVDPAALKKAIAITQTAHAMFYEQRYHDLAGGDASLAGVP